MQKNFQRTEAEPDWTQKMNDFSPIGNRYMRVVRGQAKSDKNRAITRYLNKIVAKKNTRVTYSMCSEKAKVK